MPLPTATTSIVRLFVSSDEDVSIPVPLPLPSSHSHSHSHNTGTTTTSNNNNNNSNSNSSSANIDTNTATGSKVRRNTSNVAATAADPMQMSMNHRSAVTVSVTTASNPHNESHSKEVVATDNDTACMNSNNLMSISTDPAPVSILVGYAFGPKKMSTMGIIMAEASKASRYFTIASTVNTCNETMVSENSNPAQCTMSCMSSSSLNSKHLHSQRVNSNNKDSINIGASTASVITWESCGANSISSTRKGNVHSSSSRYSSLVSNNGFNRNVVNGNERDEGIHHIHSHDSHSQHGKSVRVSPRGIRVGKLSSELVAKLSSPTVSVYDKTVVKKSAGFSAWYNDSSNHSTDTCALSCTSTISSRTATPFFGSNQHHPNTNSMKKPNIHVSFVPVDLDAPLEEQHGGHFDVILHKMTEDILLTVSSSVGDHTSADKSADEIRAMQRLERLQKYKEKYNPSCYLVDSPERIKTLMCRADIATVLTKSLIGVTSKSGVPVRAPRFVVCNDEKMGTSVDESFYSSLANQIETSPFTYPLIAKPLPAAGTAESHKLGILLGKEGLKRIQTPCILQEYSNHDGVLFKVYVLGDDVFVFERPSLPNLPIGECNHGASGSYVEFDSQRPYPKLADFDIDMDGRTRHPLNQSDWQAVESVYKRYKVDYKSFGKSCSFLTKDEISPVVRALREAFGLDLFGFDVLVTKSQDGVPATPKHNKEILVVDVNYFPSYKEVSNFPALLAKYLTQQAIHKREEMKRSI